MLKRIIASILCLTFPASGLQTAYAQPFSVNQLPVPGTMVGESAPFTPLALKGIIISPRKPLEVKFIVDTGNGPRDSASVKDQAAELVKYFLAGLTIPEGDLWVNLSPYEKSRMVPDALGQTDLGRDLLAQDYVLKQLTASLIYPENKLGRQFWSRVYAEAQARFGTTDISVNTYNKVWILPDQAQVFEHGSSAYVTASTLKVMLEADYLARQKHQVTQAGSVSSQIVREIVVPEIEREVNTGRNFAPLRQIYQALILAKWYKDTIQNAILDALYTNKDKLAGVNVDDPAVKQEIYDRYVRAYRKGAFKIIKEEAAPNGQIVPRKYFAGGTDMAMTVKKDGLLSAVTSVGAILMMTFSLTAFVPSTTAQQDKTPYEVASAASNLQSPNSAVRFDWLLKLQQGDIQTRDPNVVRALIKLLKSDDKIQQAMAAEDLGIIGPDAQEAVPDLIALLDNPDDYVAFTAAKALGGIGDTSAIPALLKLHDSIPTRDTRAFKSLINNNTNSDTNVSETMTGNVDAALRKLGVSWWQIQARDGKPVLKFTLLTSGSLFGLIGLLGLWERLTRKRAGQKMDPPAPASKGPKPGSNIPVTHDAAMLATQPPGGIDLSRIKVLSNGRRVLMRFDVLQLRRLQEGGFKGFTPVLIKMEAIKSATLPLTS